MRLKISSKQALLVATILGLILFMTLLLSFVSKNSIQHNSASFVENVTFLATQEQVRSGLPLRLKIESINVDALVEYVGLTPDGAMDVPKGPDEVAWFNLGPRPGEDGSAVIAGHYGWKNDIPAVFDNLHKLRKGDKISVENESGEITTFVVREMKIYNKDDIAPEVFGSSDEKAHLNLITCTGDWNKVEKTRFERLVVFTDEE